MTRAEKAALLMANTGNGEASGPMPKSVRQQDIEVAAYYKAEKRGFKPGFENQDWSEAEQEIEASWRMQ